MDTSSGSGGSWRAKPSRRSSTDQPSTSRGFRQAHGQPDGGLAEHGSRQLHSTSPELVELLSGDSEPETEQGNRTQEASDDDLIILDSPEGAADNRGKAHEARATGRRRASESTRQPPSKRRRRDAAAAGGRPGPGAGAAAAPAAALRGVRGGVGGGGGEARARTNQTIGQRSLASGGTPQVDTSGDEALALALQEEEDAYTQELQEHFAAGHRHAPLHNAIDDDDDDDGPPGFPAVGFPWGAAVGGVPDLGMDDVLQALAARREGPRGGRGGGARARGPRGAPPRGREVLAHLLHMPMHARLAGLVQGVLGRGGGGAGGRGRRRGGAAGRGNHHHEPAPSYEQLLALQEMMGGDVQRGLSQAQVNRFPAHMFKPRQSAAQQAVSPSSSNKGKQPAVPEGADGAAEPEAAGGGAHEAQSCSVCLEEYAEGDQLRTLPCLHQFHAPCVDRWLESSRQCPVCKHNLLDSGEDAIQ